MIKVGSRVKSTVFLDNSASGEPNLLVGTKGVVALVCGPNTRFRYSVDFEGHESDWPMMPQEIELDE